MKGVATHGGSFRLSHRISLSPAPSPHSETSNPPPPSRHTVGRSMMSLHVQGEREGDHQAEADLLAQLPDDVLADVLRRLPHGGLAFSRCVSAGRGAPSSTPGACSARSSSRSRRPGSSSTIPLLRRRHGALLTPLRGDGASRLRQAPLPTRGRRRVVGLRPRPLQRPPARRRRRPPRLPPSPVVRAQPGHALGGAVAPAPAAARRGQLLVPRVRSGCLAALPGVFSDPFPLQTRAWERLL